MSEKFHEPLAPRKIFVTRLAYSLIMGLTLIFFALLVGMLGYHFIENMAWEDAFLNAAMILSGMGQIAPLNSTAGKLFAGFYALFSGLVFIAIIGLIFAPVVHRFFHKFHVPDEESKKKKR